MIRHKIKFIGVGSAFSRKNFNSAAIVESTHVIANWENPNNVNYTTHKLLVDCGRTTPEALAEVGLSWKDIDALYVSHQHSDHIGAVEEFAFFNYFVNKTKPWLFGNEKLIDDMWNFSLKGGLASIEGKLCNLTDYFSVVKVPINDSFSYGNVNYTPIQTVHIMNGYGIVPSYGLIMKFKSENGKEQKNVFMTTDTQFCPHQIMQFYKDADLIFQDCETYDWKNGKMKSGVHAHYTDLKTLPAEIKAKMCLYHYQDGEIPDAVADGFAGFVRKGDVFEII